MDEFWALDIDRIIVLNTDGFYNNLNYYLENLNSNKMIKFVDNMEQLEKELQELYSNLESHYKAENVGSITKIRLFNNSNQQNESTALHQVEQQSTESITRIGYSH